jgi:hypothetical protein
MYNGVQEGLTVIEENKIRETILNEINNESLETVEDIVDVVETKVNFPRDKIVSIIIEMNDDGSLFLRKPIEDFQGDFLNFVLMPKSYWYWIVVFFAAITLFLVYNVPAGSFPLFYVRNIFGVIYVLFLPGFCLVKMLFPKKDGDPIINFALYIGTSLIMLPLIGLALNYSPGGIKAEPLALTLFLFIFIFSLIALYREYVKRA